MTPRKLLLAAVVVAVSSLTAGRYAGEAWNAAERRAFLAEPATLLEELAPFEDSGEPESGRRDLYGNPSTQAIDSYRIDAVGEPLDRRLVPARLELRAPEG